MPEYLSPGVFIEEVPGRLKALEGVSTSTAAFVGPAERGPVAGMPPPFTAPGGFLLAADPAPVLVTSFAEFTRQFGNPLPLPDTPPGAPDTGYLAYAVRAFFDNGGKRCYVSRVFHPSSTEADADRGRVELKQGYVLRLARAARKGDKTLLFISSRGINVGGKVSFLRRADASSALLDLPARVKGTKTGPFALNPGDTLTVKVTESDPPSTQTKTLTLQASAPELPIAAVAGTLFDFSTFPDRTLKLQVGNGPEQTATFSALDILDPEKVTRAQVANVLSRDLTGIKVFTTDTQLVIRSDVQGTSASLTVTAGKIQETLGLPTDPLWSDTAADPKTLILAALGGWLTELTAREQVGTPKESSSAQRLIASALYDSAWLLFFGVEQGEERNDIHESLRQLFRAWCESLLYKGPQCAGEPHGVVIGCTQVAGGMLGDIDPFGGRRWVMHAPLISHWGAQFGMAPLDVTASRFFSTICCISALPPLGAQEEAPAVVIELGGSFLTFGRPEAVAEALAEREELRVVESKTVSAGEFVALVIQALMTEHHEQEPRWPTATRYTLGNPMAPKVLSLVTPIKEEIVTRPQREQGVQPPVQIAKKDEPRIIRKNPETVAEPGKTPPPRPKKGKR